MDDYHDFGRDYVVEMDAWRRHYSPNYMSITQGGVGTNGVIRGVVASGVASSSTSEGTRRVVGGGTRKGTSGHSGGAGSEDTSNGTSSLVVDS
ncbi:hypothetical protein AXG93_109s1000 [Marchantia polymorpha subsp. ruderalis]|uniref:Uncharacterized protein n=1 Tax=Marchantia polymorpha subsp. ruderalis TaxID=1480154 RepID=A0A176W4L8_MARPO|nr:hypothetical protein AXG93_109s1000 [Marchantia polymorpha subsp. ruderalis]